MSLFKKILVPTDFSPNSEAGLNYALEMAAEFNAEILLFNVMRIPYGFASQVEDYKTNMQEYAHTWMEEKISQIRKTNKYSKLKIDYAMSFGHVVSEMIRKSNEFGADLIILTSKGGAEGHKYLGSVVSDLMQFSEVPVISVPYDISEIEWNDLVLATDYNSGDIDAVKFLSDLATHFKSTMHIVHVDEEQELQNEIMFLGFEQKVKDTLGNFELSFEDIYGDDFIEGIGQYLENEPCSLLTLTRNKKSSFRRLLDNSIASKVPMQAHVPVLIWVNKEDH
ncbi:universal stress protein [Balneola sp. MJW-20]|uniref:universal stress protein n=1 Tax=Gracilimonas aurantiaca TaxID=3234185 RepID=UPI0034650D9D